MQHATKTWLWTIVSLVPRPSPSFLSLAVQLFRTASDGKLGRPRNEANYSSRWYWSIAWLHACRKNSPVKCEELRTILCNYSDLNTSQLDRWPATANPKNYEGLGHVSTPFCIVHVWVYYVLYCITFCSEGVKMRITLLGWCLVFILQLLCMESLQAMSDSPILNLCDLAIEHQNSFVDYAPLKSWCSPVLRLHFVAWSMYILKVMESWTVAWEWGYRVLCII